ncbi:uncharacterized protein [Triticum aestivum]|uniref:uncharacterized protein isoform X3 n=1 Tax=Triticum aestivum TaxID=4565 RepID=UPI001D027630|nr:uncharacterized protein LOC123090546 isoform X3 [Triticum aestivum]
MAAGLLLVVAAAAPHRRKCRPRLLLCGSAPRPYHSCRVSLRPWPCAARFAASASGGGGGGSEAPSEGEVGGCGAERTVEELQRHASDADESERGHEEGLLSVHQQGARQAADCSGDEA